VIPGYIVGPYGVVPDIAKKAVAFLYAPRDGQLAPIGTGFFLGYPHPTDEKQQFRFLVTNRHIVTDKVGEIVSELHVRLNTKTGTAKLLPLDINDITFPTDASIDVALLPGWLEGQDLDTCAAASPRLPPLTKPESVPA
jgi:hypothetical protein